MKILITVQTYYPKKDGVQMVTEYMAEGLKRKGHDITILTSSKGNLKKEETYNGINIKRVNLFTKNAAIIGNIKEYKKILLEEANNSDIMINVCTQNAFTDVALKIINNINCKKILYLHGMHDFKFHKYDFDNIKTFVKKVIKNIVWKIYYIKNGRFFKKYDSVIQLHQMCVGYDYFKEKYNISSYIIENAADDRFFIELEKNNNSRDYVICVSNYICDKNQEMIIKAFYLSEKSKDLDLVFIGSRDTPYLKKLKKIYDEYERMYEHRNIKFLTGISREETINYVKNASLFLFSSKHEIYPLSIVEAMAAGIPFISTDVGCVRALPGGKIINNEKEMAYNIDNLFDNRMIKDKIGELGKVYAFEHLKTENKISKLNSLIEEIVGGKL